MRKKSKTRRRKQNRHIRYTKKRVGGKIQRQYNILNWENLTVPERKAATMNIFANVSTDFMTRQGVTPTDQKAHLASILGLIYQHGFAKLPGDVTDDYEGAYQKALEPIDPTKITSGEISEEQFNNAYQNTLQNVEKEAKEEGLEQEFIDSNEQAEEFDKIVREKDITEGTFYKKFPNHVIENKFPQKSREQLEKEHKFVEEKIRKSVTPKKHISSKQRAIINRNRPIREQLANQRGASGKKILR